MVRYLYNHHGVVDPVPFWRRIYRSDLNNGFKFLKKVDMVLIYHLCCFYKLFISSVNYILHSCKEMGGGGGGRELDSDLGPRQYSYSWLLKVTVGYGPVTLAIGNDILD